jgi:cbb3-type cytochrome oxidase subunit 3
MTGGIVTLLALLGFLAVVVYVFIIKRREDFDEQARQPLEDSNEQLNHSEDHRNGGSSEDGEKQS